jgi:predicted AAA+ superfamily ATPase
MDLDRGLEPAVHRLCDVAKVVILEGGRGVGKTTLAQRIAQQREVATSFDLSDPGDRQALATDPHRVLAASPRPVLIDEAQLEPELPLAVKRIVDADAAPGQFLLTGSARLGRGALGGTDPLAGRAVRLRLRSFTQGELGGQPVDLLGDWWTNPPAPAVYPDVTLADLYQRMVTGGLPTVALASATTDAALTRRLVEAYVEGVLAMEGIDPRVDRSRLLQTFRYLASNPAQILNLSRAASDLGVRVETIRNHLSICEARFLIDIAGAHRPREHQTVVAHPRLFAADPALAAWAAETSATRLVRDSQLAGALLENFVAHELAAQAEWSPTPATLLHWRDARAKKEVDLVVRSTDGDMIAIEVKSASTVSDRDTAGLRAFADRAGDRAVRSIVVYTGRAVQQIDDMIWAVPIGAFFGARSAG